jgi:hypothetical protein
MHLEDPHSPVYYYFFKKKKKKKNAGNLLFSRTAQFHAFNFLDFRHSFYISTTSHKQTVSPHSDKFSGTVWSHHSLFLLGRNLRRQQSVLVLGLILGTTFSCVGAFQKAKGEIIANEVGNRISLPSIVSFHQDQRVCRRLCLFLKLILNPSRIQEFKRRDEERGLSNSRDKKDKMFL